MHQQKLQQFKNNYSSPENYPIIQHTDVTLNTNKTEPFIQSNHDTNYAGFFYSIKFFVPAMDNFIPKSPTLYNYFYEGQTEVNDTLLYKTQQQYPVLRQRLFWKQYKNFPQTPSLTIQANKRLLHYYQRFQNEDNPSINEDNNLYITYKKQHHQNSAYHSLIWLFFIKQTRDTLVVKNTRNNH